MSPLSTIILKILKILNAYKIALSFQRRGSTAQLANSVDFIIVYFRLLHDSLLSDCVGFRATGDRGV